MRFARLNSAQFRFAAFGLLVVIFASAGAIGQTEEQLGAKFKRISAFEIRPGIEVFPTFAADGNVCRLVVEKRQYINPASADFDSVIPSSLATLLVDELVPEKERGKPLSPYLSSESFVAGGASFLKKDYENVSVGMYGSTVEGRTSGVSVIVISWPKRKCISSQ